jgi:hypothetical protein
LIGFRSPVSGLSFFISFLLRSAVSGFINRASQDYKTGTNSLLSS